LYFNKQGGGGNGDLYRAHQTAELLLVLSGKSYYVVRVSVIQPGVSQYGIYMTEVHSIIIINSVLTAHEIV